MVIGTEVTKMILNPIKDIEPGDKTMNSVKKIVVSGSNTLSTNKTKVDEGEKDDGNGTA